MQQAKSEQSFGHFNKTKEMNYFIQEGGTSEIIGMKHLC